MKNVLMTLSVLSVLTLAMPARLLAEEHTTGQQDKAVATETKPSATDPVVADENAPDNSAADFTPPGEGEEEEGIIED